MRHSDEMNSVAEMRWMSKNNLLLEMFFQSKEKIVDDLQLINELTLHKGCV